MSSTPDYYGHARREVIPFLPLRFRKVSDIGGSSGATLSAIREVASNIVTVCVDGHIASVERAIEKGHIAIQCDLNTEFPEICADSDVVLFLDILEHLIDPWSVLSRAVQSLRSGTTVIVSLPNVRFWEVSVNLAIWGRWELKDAGVLDRTHLRFFTKSTGARLLTSSGLALQKRVGKLPGARRYSWLNRLSFGIASDFLCQQYIYVGIKP